MNATGATSHSTAISRHVPPVAIADEVDVGHGTGGLVLVVPRALERRYVAMGEFDVPCRHWRLEFDKIGLVRGHDLVGLAREHGEVLAGFSLALFEGLFVR